MNILEKFLDFEKEHNLFELKYRGVSYWHLIRFYVWLEIEKTQGLDEEHPDKLIHENFVNRMNFLKYIPSQVLKCFHKGRKDIFISSNNRLKIIDDKTKDIYTYIIEEGKYSWDKNVLFSSGYTKDIKKYYNNALLDIYNAYIYIILKIKKFFNKSTKDVVQFVSEMENELEIKLDHNRIAWKIEFACYRFKVFTNYYKRILNGRYKMVFMICHYSFYQAAIIEAAKRCNIPVVEYQHGMIGCHHISYNFKDKTSIGKYLPDYLLTFGNYWNDTCRLPDKCKCISVGSTLIEDSRKNLKNVNVDEKLIVFYSSGSYGRQLSKIAIDLVPFAEKHGLNILYKLHPSEAKSWKERYPYLNGLKILKVIDEPINVHILLSKAKFHIGVNSTVLFEALAFNRRVFVYDMFGKEFMEDILKWGFAELFKDLESLEMLILSQNSSNSNNTIGQQVSDFMFKPNAKHNIEHLIGEILNENKK